MYVRNCWYVAAWSYELPQDDSVIRRIIANEPIAIYRKTDGGLVGLADSCVHRGLPLSMGCREGDDLRCAYHGMRFDPSGACVEIPGKDRVPPAAKVRSYPVVQQASWIWVWLGEPAAADTDLIPVSTSLDDPAWSSRGGFVDYKAYYELVNDNLTDLSHVAYVHANTFGGGSNWTDAYELEMIDRGIRVSRWIIPDGSSKLPPRGPAFEVWQVYDYVAPGVLLMENRMYPPGTADASGRRAPGAEAPQIGKSLSWQAVTPTTETATRYFFAIATGARVEGAEMMTNRSYAVAAEAFEEDRAIIEAQQANLDLTRAQMLMIGHDRGPTRFRAILRELADAETPSGALAPNRLAGE